MKKRQPTIFTVAPRIGRCPAGGAALALGFHDAFLVGAGFSVLAVILSVVAKDERGRSEAASVRRILFLE